jgi:DUF4097 and DUF4098 domain-containing protein YvlB
MSGDVEITTAGPGAFDVRTVSGDLRLRADSVSTLRATTTSGDLEVAGTFDGDGPYLMESVSGDVALEASGNASVEVRTITGDVGGNAAMEHGDRGVRTIRIGAGGPTIDIRSSSGDVTVSARAAAHDPSESLAVPTAVSAEPSAIVASAPDDLARLEILRAVERGELDTDVARERLDAIETDDAEPADPEDQTRVG